MTNPGIVTDTPPRVSKFVLKVKEAYSTYLRGAIDAERDRGKRRRLEDQLLAHEKTYKFPEPAVVTTRKPVRVVVAKAAKARREIQGFVYFAAGPNTPIKIGFSTSPESRVASLQTSHWERLEILACTPGTLELEASYHSRFQRLRLSGEWFRRSRLILAEISKLNKEQGPLQKRGYRLPTLRSAAHV